MRSKLLFLFPDRAQSRLIKVNKAFMPSERLYGLVELRQRGWNAKISDSRWEGAPGLLRRRFRRFFELPCPTVLREMRRSDVIVVKDDFSTTLLTEASLMGKPLVYLDAMFEIPKAWHERQALAYNLKHASAVCCYSQRQAIQWAETFKLPASRFEIMPYCIDADFYPELIWKRQKRGYIFAVGRDLGRDYDTLLSACEKIGLRLKLVTLSYLIPERAMASPLVEVFQNLSYSQLFDLYAGSAMAAIPLKKNISYPSGIRALLESTALGVPTVVTETKVLPEYLKNKVHVRYMAPESVEAMADTMQAVLDDPMEAEAMALRASIEVRSRFTMQHFADAFEQVIARI